MCYGKFLTSVYFHKLYILFLLPFLAILLLFWFFVINTEMKIIEFFSLVFILSVTHGRRSMLLSDSTEIVGEEENAIIVFEEK